MRGGTWSDVPWVLRLADRDFDAQGYRGNSTGRRIVRTP
jgi:formylglycine-generating enzyme required for sulfatase activity